jgi:hypothetical protein
MKRMFKKKTRCKIKHETLKIEKIQAVRAMYVHPGNPESQEVEIRLRTDEGELLELRLESRFVPQLLQELRISYDAIVPPMYTGRWNSNQEGMQI